MLHHHMHSLKPDAMNYPSALLPFMCVQRLSASSNGMPEFHLALACALAQMLADTANPARPSCVAHASKWVGAPTATDARCQASWLTWETLVMLIGTQSCRPRGPHILISQGLRSMTIDAPAMVRGMPDWREEACSRCTRSWDMLKSGRSRPTRAPLARPHL